MSDKLSRRDWFKVAGAGAASLIAINAGIEVSQDRHFINALKVTRELNEAQISKDPNRIYESRKLAMVWLFVETAIKFSDEMGLGRAGKTMEHYLYGNGETLDISFVFEEISEMSPGSFVGNLISSAIKNSQDYIGNEVTAENEYTFTKRALKDLKSERGLKTSLDAESIVSWRELRYAFGGAQYELHAPKAFIESDELQYGQRIILEEGVEITITDRYDWEKDFKIYLPGKVSEVVEHVAEPILDKFYESRDLVYQTIRDLGLSEDDSNKIIEIYSDDNKENTLFNIVMSTRDFVEESNMSLINQPDLIESDFNLLKIIGAADYDMRGYVNLPYRLEFTV